MIVFLLVRFIPGNIIDIMESEIGASGGQVDRVALLKLLGLNAPVWVQ